MDFSKVVSRNRLFRCIYNNICIENLENIKPGSPSISSTNESPSEKSNESPSEKSNESPSEKSNESPSELPGLRQFRENIFLE
jgi:hypothetical protein